MRFKVRPLRVRGRRIDWRQVLNGPVFEGDLCTYELQVGAHRVKAASLAGLDPALAKQLPELYEPVLVGIAPLALVLRGFERVPSDHGAYTVLQEWHCELPERSQLQRGSGSP